MKNLLTDDTSNLYERGQPVLIEYASVILFESDDESIPTTAELDALVVDAFTGTNGDSYVDGLQNLPDDNPFSTTTTATLQPVSRNQGRTVVGTISRVSTKGMLPPFMAAAAFCVLLAGGALAYKSRNSGGDGKDSNMKGFDTFSRSEATAMTDDYTHSLGSMSETSNRTRRGWDLALEENQPNLSPITEHHLDPDLAGWNDYFDSSNGSKDSDKSAGEHSQYSIEDFVNEAERNLLGVRIRYPGQIATDGTKKTEEAAKTKLALPPAETSTALVPVPPSTIVPTTSSSIIPVPSNSLVPATPDEIVEASSQIEL